MNLRDLLRASGLAVPERDSNPTVSDVVQDTRNAKEPGFVFVARRGEAFDGYRFVAKAVQLGAVAVVGEASEEETRHTSWSEKVPHIRVQNDKVALAKLAAAFYGRPSASLFTLGVTGTDGKTTTAYLLHHLLQGSYKTGLLSTAGVRLGGEPLVSEGHFTTPEAPQVQNFLAQFRDGGCSHAVVESSSHGFALRRLDEVDYDVGVWTNLSPEHLDYHKTFEAYRGAKASLMRRAAVSVLNADEPEFSYFAGQAKEVISYGANARAAYRAVDVREEAGRLAWGLEAQGKRFGATLSMIGRYNVHNALAALAAAQRTGLEIETLLERLATFPGVPGRMQLVQRQPFAVVVDFAHTAPALEKALRAVRPQTAGRLIVLVGAAGERDPGKRAPLGRVAAQHADIAIFTEEDSRSEDAGVILAEMARGAEEVGAARGEVWLEPERRAAIQRAVRLARPGDLILLAGKGHETTLERKDETLPWDEVAEARRALSERGALT